MKVLRVLGCFFNYPPIIPPFFSPLLCLSIIWEFVLSRTEGPWVQIGKGIQNEGFQGFGMFFFSYPPIIPPFLSPLLCLSIVWEFVLSRNEGLWVQIGKGIQIEGSQGFGMFLFQLPPNYTPLIYSPCLSIAWGFLVWVKLRVLVTKLVDFSVSNNYQLAPPSVKSCFHTMELLDLLAVLLLKQQLRAHCKMI